MSVNLNRFAVCAQRASHLAYDVTNYVVTDYFLCCVTVQSTNRRSKCLEIKHAIEQATLSP